MLIYQNCKNCGAQISAQAKTCPHCKTVLVKEEPKPKPKPKRRDWETIPGTSGPKYFIPKKHRIIFAVTALVIGWIVYANQGRYLEVSHTDYGSNWSFLVPRLELSCRVHNYGAGIKRPHVLIHVNGQTLALNGAARGSGLYADSRTIMKPERWRYNATNDLIGKGLKLCSWEQ